ncbi:hypothetical protein ACP3V3_01705 [Vibrio sp. PNB22_3_1]
MTHTFTQLTNLTKQAARLQKPTSKAEEHQFSATTFSPARLQELITWCAKSSDPNIQSELKRVIQHNALELKPLLDSVTQSIKETAEKQTPQWQQETLKAVRSAIIALYPSIHLPRFDKLIEAFCTYQHDQSDQYEVKFCNGNNEHDIPNEDSAMLTISPPHGEVLSLPLTFELYNSALKPLSDTLTENILYANFKDLIWEQIPMDDILTCINEYPKSINEISEIEDHPELIAEINDALGYGLEDRHALPFITEQIGPFIDLFLEPEPTFKGAEKTAQLFKDLMPNTECCTTYQATRVNQCVLNDGYLNAHDLEYVTCDLGSDDNDKTLYILPLDDAINTLRSICISRTLFGALQALTAYNEAHHFYLPSLYSKQYQADPLTII